MVVLRKRVLMLDHDDTAVRSTETIHYPAHQKAVRELTPDQTPCSLSQWFEKCHRPGVSQYLASIFTPEQMQDEHKIWARETRAAGPAPFFDGIPELLTEFRRRGGHIVVISHGLEATIRADYRQLDEGAQPDMIFGWSSDPGKKKPAPYPALKALEVLGYPPEQALVLDDLSPGIQMAAQVPGLLPVAAGWGHSVPSIEADMRKHSAQYFATVQDFAAWLFGGEANL